ncbi:MAG: type II secretion system protein [FCB group bacterium]|jgi:prepilin-type N-terminal cleavage/methylation domain-containing protein|nr:type II secretion system protein [FCB group bacterium]
MTKRHAQRGGFSLLELTIALALFAVALGSVAQVLVSASGTITLQQQRVSAARDCQALLSDIRALRNTSPGAFPDTIVASWPNNRAVPGNWRLPGQTMTVTYANTASNPLTVTVTARWRNIDGHPAVLTMSTILTGE